MKIVMSGSVAKAVMPSKTTKLKYEYVKELHELDVLLGRGDHSVRYSGNVHFRRIVAQWTELYMTARRNRDKERIARTVINEVHAKGGRFLARNIHHTNSEERNPPSDHLWIRADDAVVLKKVKQAFRDHDSAESGKKMKHTFEEKNPQPAVPYLSNVSGNAGNSYQPMGNSSAMTFPERIHESLAQDTGSAFTCHANAAQLPLWQEQEQQYALYDSNGALRYSTVAQPTPLLCSNTSSLPLQLRWIAEPPGIAQGGAAQFGSPHVHTTSQLLGSNNNNNNNNVSDIMTVAFHRQLQLERQLQMQQQFASAANMSGSVLQRVPASSSSSLMWLPNNNHRAAIWADPTTAALALIRADELARQSQRSALVMAASIVSHNNSNKRRKI